MLWVFKRSRAQADHGMTATMTTFSAISLVTKC